MNKFISLALVIIGLSLNLNAQDKKAKTLLSEVTSKIKKFDNISIEFKYTLNNSKENINQDSKGSVVLQGNK
jgi:outer membrane lipoprotein-sorting protein